MNYLNDSAVEEIVRSIFDVRSARSQRDRGTFEEACKNDAPYISRLRQATREVLEAFERRQLVVLEEGTFIIKKSMTLTRRPPTTNKIPSMRRDTINVEERRKINYLGHIGPTKRRGT